MALVAGGFLVFWDTADVSVGSLWCFAVVMQETVHQSPVFACITEPDPDQAEVREADAIIQPSLRIGFRLLHTLIVFVFDPVHKLCSRQRAFLSLLFTLYLIVSLSCVLTSWPVCPFNDRPINLPPPFRRVTCVRQVSLLHRQILMCET